MSTIGEMLEVLGQDDVWVDRSGAERPLDGMGQAYLANLRRFLDRNADYFKASLSAAALATLDGGKIAEVAFDRVDAGVLALETTPAAEWMAEFPLYRRISELLDGVSDGAAA